MDYYKKKKLFLSSILFLFIPVSVFSQNKDVSKKDSVSISSESKSIHNTYFNYSPKNDTISFKNKSHLIDQLEHLEFASGTVYFSGTGFPDVISTSVKQNIGAALSNFFDKCVAGSVITFEKCIVKGSDGKPSKMLHKSIVIQ